MTMEKEVILCPDLKTLALRASDLFVELSKRSVASRHRFTVALSGGSTPRSLYRILSSDPVRGRVPWSSAFVFWGDERCVPPDHPESNYQMARDTLLAHVPIPPDHIFRIPAELNDPSHAAVEYERQLRDVFRIAPTEAPRFDLILLGMGDDGHVASLFPGSAALAMTDRLVAGHYVVSLKRYRVTLTLPTINSAACVIFLISGATKARTLKTLLEGDPRVQWPAAEQKKRGREAGKLTSGNAEQRSSTRTSLPTHSGTVSLPHEKVRSKTRPEPLPAQLVCPKDGRLIYLIDRAAARDLSLNAAGMNRTGE